MWEPRAEEEPGKDAREAEGFPGGSCATRSRGGTWPQQGPRQDGQVS